MALKICEGDDERILQLELTRRGVCARCGEGVAQHADGDCSDGGGSYTWAQTRAELEQTIKNLEKVIGSKN